MVEHTTPKSHLIQYLCEMKNARLVGTQLCCAIAVVSASPNETSEARRRSAQVIFKHRAVKPSFYGGQSQLIPIDLLR
jgi:hypothetical protein